MQYLLYRMNDVGSPLSWNFFLGHRAFCASSLRSLARYRVRAGAEFFFFVFFCVESAPDRPTWVMTWLGGLVRSLNHSGDFTLNQWEIGNNRAECETRCGWLHAYKHYRINPTQSSWIQSHVGLSTGFNKQNNLMRKINRINSDYETL